MTSNQKLYLFILRNLSPALKLVKEETGRTLTYRHSYMKKRLSYHHMFTDEIEVNKSIVEDERLLNVIKHELAHFLRLEKISSNRPSIMYDRLHDAEFYNCLDKISSIESNQYKSVPNQTGSICHFDLICDNCNTKYKIFNITEDVIYNINNCTYICSECQNNKFYYTRLDQ